MLISRSRTRILTTVNSVARPDNMVGASSWSLMSAQAWDREDLGPFSSARIQATPIPVNISTLTSTARAPLL